MRAALSWCAPFLTKRLWYLYFRTRVFAIFLFRTSACFFHCSLRVGLVWFGLVSFGFVWFGFSKPNIRRIAAPEYAFVVLSGSVSNAGGSVRRNRPAAETGSVFLSHGPYSAGLHGIHPTVIIHPPTVIIHRSSSTHPPQNCSLPTPCARRCALCTI